MPPQRQKLRKRDRPVNVKNELNYSGEYHVRVRKYYNGFCERCDESRKLVLFESDKEQEILRLRCSECLTVDEVPWRRVLKTGQVLDEQEFQNRKEALSEVQDYDPEKRYWRGQKIRHPVLDDVGKVVAKGETGDSHKVITVDFENNGTRVLVEQYAVSS